MTAPPFRLSADSTLSPLAPDALLVVQSTVAESAAIAVTEELSSPHVMTEPPARGTIASPAPLTPGAFPPRAMPFVQYTFGATTTI